MKRHWTALATALVLCWLHARVSAQETFALAAEQFKDSSHVLLSMAQYSMPVGGRPTQLKAVPPGLSRSASYYIVRLGGREAILILDRGNLFVDVGGKGSQDTPIPGTRAVVAGRRILRFGPVTVPVGAADSAAQSVAVVVEIATDDTFAPLRLYPADYRAGQVQLEGRSYQVAVVDADLDGRYATAFSPRDAEWDWLAMDRNGNGRVDGRAYSSDELMPLPRMVQLGERYYGIQVATDGSAISVEPIQPQMVRIDVGTPYAVLDLLSDSGIHNLSGSNGVWELPAGTYKAYGRRLRQPDERRITWELQASGSRGALDAFVLSGDQPPTLKVGPPLVGSVSAKKQPDGSFAIGYSLTGQAGEQYSPGALINGAMSPAPAFKIIAESGEVLLKGFFEYG